MSTSAAAPFVVDVRPLLGKPGAYQRVDLTEPAGEGIGTPVVTLAADAPVHVVAMLESVREGILVTGTASAVGTAACSRCLDPVEVDRGRGHRAGRRGGRGGTVAVAAPAGRQGGSEGERRHEGGGEGGAGGATGHGAGR